jgi:hypothetical protein
MASRSPSPAPSIGSEKTDVSGAKSPRKFQNGWTREQEKLMANWSDIAACYRWLHDRTEKFYYKRNMAITIPVIILSTLTGTANFAVGGFTTEPDQKLYASAAIGSLSILAGIMTTLGNFFQFAQNSESNRVASIAWGKFQRLLAVELAIKPDDRIAAMDFLQICRQDLDRLIEQSPQIPDQIIVAFEEEFKDMPTLKRPDICHGLEHTSIYNSNTPRLMQVAADAAIMLKSRKRFLRDEVMPDLDSMIRTKVEEELKNRSGTTTPFSFSNGPGAGGPGANPTDNDWRSLLTMERGRSRTRANSIVDSTLRGAPPPSKVVVAGDEEAEAEAHSVASTS